MRASESLQNDQSTATENALRRAVDTTPAFIHTARPDGYLDYFNRGWLGFLGKSLEDVCGWRWTESVHPADVAALVQKWHAALASGEPLEVESRVRRADGSYRALLHRNLPLHDEQGKIVKWFGSSIDIEDRKCAEEQLRRSAQELQRSEFYLREGERLAHMGSWSLRPDGTFVAIELLAISWIRNRYMDTPFLRAAFQVIVGGVLVFLVGIWIGSS